jgi:hypothetical protein
MNLSAAIWLDLSRVTTDKTSLALVLLFLSVKNLDADYLAT